jgi:hypothetical protein
LTTWGPCGTLAHVTTTATPHVKWRIPANVQRTARVRSAQLGIRPGEYVTRLINDEASNRHLDDEFDLGGPGETVA